MNTEEKPTPAFDLSTVRLAVAVPTVRGVHPHTVVTLMALASNLAPRLGCFWIAFSDAASCALGRGQCTAETLDSPRRYTHMLSLDDDVSTKPDVIERMLACNVPVAGANYRQKTEDRALVDYAVGLRDQYFSQTPRADGTIATDAVPGGLTLWRRDALERLDAAHPRICAAESGSASGIWLSSFFLEEITPDRCFNTEDYSACHRHVRLGGEVRMLLDADTGHHQGRRHRLGNFLRDEWIPRGMATIAASVPAGLPSRNSPCPCGSGKKSKRCHGALPEAC